MEEHVACHAHGVVQVALDLVEHVLRRTPEEYRASLGVLALGQEGEVLVADLLDLEQAALRADVGLLDVVDAVDDSGTRGAGNTVVVRLPDTAKSRDVGLDEVVLRQICAPSCENLRSNAAL